MASAFSKFNGVLPPGPVAVPIIGSFVWITSSVVNLEPVLRQLWRKYGPIMTIRLGSRTVIFICSNTLTHEVLVGKGAVFADRPPVTAATRVHTANQHTITSGRYGPVWRVLRRNLMTEILHPAQVKSYHQDRVWVLNLLIQQLESLTRANGSVQVMEPFRFSMFCLLLFMCSGERLDEKVVREVEKAQRAYIKAFVNLNIFVIFPRIGKWVFPKMWKDLVEIRRRQVEVLLPLIKAREAKHEKRLQINEGGKSFKDAYIDSLLVLEIPDDGGRKLTYDEMVSLCSEFLNAGSDSTATALEWIMANIVKYPEIQEKLVKEIEEVVGERHAHGGEENPRNFIEEEDLKKMPYLKAVVMESLRLHPPLSYVLPHAVMEEVEINGYVIPKEATVNFSVASVARDEKIWKDPLEFKPERFMEKEAVDITGTREIKMMPFGVGRRICPGLGVAMLHLEWFVANLVREFEWKTKKGEEVDLTERIEFTTIMENPVNVVLHRRSQRVQNT
ncbi:cytochrome P450 89A2-like [Aristolochia californica]|uniref:cytochrome P450 89A2-like n=1 Tax=Aristolochia californica TaxID=171875 RepID=UPI0035E25AC4